MCGCGKPTWNGEWNQKCSMFCTAAVVPPPSLAVGADSAAAPVCGCGKPTWNGKWNQKCSESCEASVLAAFGHVGLGIQLTSGDCTATRVSGVANGVCLSKEPLRQDLAGRYFELRVDGTFTSPRALAVGVATKPAADMIRANGKLKCEEARGTYERAWLVGYDKGGA